MVVMDVTAIEQDFSDAKTDFSTFSGKLSHGMQHPQEGVIHEFLRLLTDECTPEGHSKTIHGVHHS